MKKLKLAVALIRLLWLQARWFLARFERVEMEQAVRRAREHSTGLQCAVLDQQLKIQAIRTDLRWPPPDNCGWQNLQ